MANNPYFLTWQEVLDQLISFLPPAWRPVTGKVLTRLLVAVSLAIEALYALLARLLRLSIIATSEGEWLKALVAGFGMTTFAGTASSVVVRFSVFAGKATTIEIPLGTQVAAQNGQTFRTAIASSLPAGALYVDVPCRAEKTGVSGNIPAGSIITLISSLAGIDRVDNPNPGSGGSDGETDTEIKLRVPPYLESLHRATIPATEYVIKYDRSLFPEVSGFVTQRNYGVPGYFRGILADQNGGDIYRARDWISVGNGIYYIRTGLATINGLVSAGWPCKRFGVVSRAENGEELWLPSAFVTELENGLWRFCHDRPSGRLYAKADGRDLNTLNCTIVSGVIYRALRELELRWASNGVFCDVLAPFLVQGDVELRYVLEPGYNRPTVEAALKTAAIDYASSLRLGAGFELEGLYTRLSLVAGAGGVVVVAPEDNIAVEPDSIFRLNSVAIV